MKIGTNAPFAGTVWEDEDAQAQAAPDRAFLDLLVADLGRSSTARTLPVPGTYDELQHFIEISNSDQPVLLAGTRRHGLVSEDFVRNTSPDCISAEQDGFPVALRDAYLFVTLFDQVPEDTAMALRWSCAPTGGWASTRRGSGR